MSVTLSLFAGVGAQFLDNNGNILSGGLIYTYSAGTTTPLATFTTNLGTVAQPNPIVLDSAGRIPGGELWLTTGYGYKFVNKDSNGVLIGTYDNVPSSAQPPITNDASSISYEQGALTTAGSFIVGYTYLITSIGSTNFQLIGATSNTVGLHFIATGVGTGTGTAQLSRTVQLKLQESISVLDFGAVADWNGSTGTNNSVFFQSAINYLNSVGGGSLYIPKGSYYLENVLNCYDNIRIFGDSILSSNLYINSNNCFNSNNASNISFENFSIIGNTTTSGNAFDFGTSGWNSGNVYLNRISVRGVNHAIYIANGSDITCMEVNFCTFILNKSWHVYISDGASVNSINYTSTRFEENDNVGAYKVFGGITANGETVFLSCVFESLAGQYAIDFTANGHGYRLINCHFENNCCAVGGTGGTPVDNGSEINVGYGNGNIVLQGCGFGPPNSTATNFNCINLPSSLTRLVVDNCVFAFDSTSASNVIGYLLAPYNSDVFWQANTYYNSTTNYFSNINTPTYSLDGNQNGKFGKVRSSIVKYLQTTNATPESIYYIQYFFGIPSQSVLITAEIVATNVDGTVYASFLLRQLITVDASYNETLRGNINETPIKSDAGLDVSFSLTNSGTSAAGFGLNVTGLAGTTISWVANISYTQIAY